MIVYDGIYRLPNGSDQRCKPRSQWVYAWQVRIINLDLSQPTVKHIKPMVVVVNQTGSKPCLTSCAESIGKKISRDFCLDIARVLWIEQFPHNLKRWYVADFKTKFSFGPDIHYHIQWRPIRPKELDIINPFISEKGIS